MLLGSEDGRYYLFLQPMPKHLVTFIFETVLHNSGNNLNMYKYKWLWTRLSSSMMLLRSSSSTNYCWCSFPQPADGGLCSYLTMYMSTGRNGSKWGSLTVFKMPNICLAAKASFYPKGHLAWQTFSHLWIGDLLIYLFTYLGSLVLFSSSTFSTVETIHTAPAFYYCPHENR